MTMRKLIHDREGASAVEFALLLPLLLLLLFGIIDAGRWMWALNQQEKAAQMGARMAVVTNAIAPGIASSYLGVDGLTQGDLIPASSFGKISCTSSGCSCATTPCPALGTADSVAFNNLVARMQNFLPELTAANVAVEYSTSGLGFAGNPNGPDLVPLVTVKIGSPATPVRFNPITSFLLATMDMPTVTTTLTAEDLSGAQSN
jgi:hypothetical protein